MDTLHTKTLPFLVPFIGSFLATHTLSPIAPPPPPMGQSRLTTPNGAIPHRPSTSLFPFSPKSHNPIVGKRKWKREELCGTPRYVELRYHWRVHILWSRRIHILWSRRILKLHMRPDFSNCGYCNRSTHCTNVTLDQSLTCKKLVFLC